MGWAKEVIGRHGWPVAVRHRRLWVWGDSFERVDSAPCRLLSACRSFASPFHAVEVLTTLEANGFGIVTSSSSYSTVRFGSLGRRAGPRSLPTPPSRVRAASLLCLLTSLHYVNKYPCTPHAPHVAPAIPLARSKRHERQPIAALVFNCDF